MSYNFFFFNKSAIAINEILELFDNKVKKINLD